MKNRFLLPIISVFFLLLPPVTFAVVHCETCEKYKESMEQHQEKVVRLKKIIETNKEVLARLSPSESSKRIKVNSNILIGTLQLETVENNLVALKVWFDKNPCGRCISQKMRGKEVR